MPSGKTHFNIWKMGWSLCLPLTITLALATSDWYMLALFPLGYLMGRWIDPDLDLVGMSNAESRMMADFKIVGALITGWFVPYAYLMRFVGTDKRKGHRNFFSHFPGVSTIIRLAWLLWPTYLGVWYQYGVTIPLDKTIIVFAGLTLADTLHYGADVLIGDNHANQMRKRR